MKAFKNKLTGTLFYPVSYDGVTQASALGKLVWAVVGRFFPVYLDEVDLSGDKMFEPIEAPAKIVCGPLEDIWFSW